MCKQIISYNLSIPKIDQSDSTSCYYMVPPARRTKRLHKELSLELGEEFGIGRSTKKTNLASISA